MFNKKRNSILGQSTLEYAIFIGVVVSAFLLLHPYISNAVKGRLHSSADDIGDQFTLEPNTPYAIQGISQSFRKEEVGTANVTASQAWTRSEILGAAVGTLPTDAKLTAYTGSEISKEDYVKSSPGTGTVSTEHTTMDLGPLKGKKIIGE